MTRALVKLDPSALPGTHRSRVFVGGSYREESRPLLEQLGDAVVAGRFDPIIADRYQLLIPDRDIHDVTLSLLHSCRLAIFEASQMSGALMEIERAVDYGTRCLILYADPAGRGWQVSRMLNSLVLEHEERMALVSYARGGDALAEAERWLRAMRRSRI